MSEFDTKESDFEPAPPRGQDVGDLEDADALLGRGDRGDRGDRGSRGGRRPRR